MYALIASPFLHAAVVYPLLICIRSSDVYQPIGNRTPTNREAAITCINISILATAG